MRHLPAWSHCLASLTIALQLLRCSTTDAGPSPDGAEAGASHDTGGAAHEAGAPSTSSGGAGNGAQAGASHESAGASSQASGGAHTQGGSSNAAGATSAAPGGGAAGDGTTGTAGALPGNAGAGGATDVPACTGEPQQFATSVTAHEFGSGQDYGQEEFPTPVLGPPAGGGRSSGSLKVTSLGEGGFVVLEFGSTVIVDGPGADFLVFENPFVPQGANAEDVFAELGSVSVSQDGEHFVDFPCDATAYPYGSCAGWHPVLANADNGALGPLTAGSAGGDAFDLADVGLSWARYVRIQDRVDVDGTFDLDAVGLIHSSCAP